MHKIVRAAIASAAGGLTAVLVIFLLAFLIVGAIYWSVQLWWE
jgi:hypothetical protein